MTMRHRLIRGSARRGLAMFSAAAMLSTMLAVPALAEHYEDATVLEGDDAIEAALAWSGLSASSDAVAIGRNDVFADNLSSGLIQGLGDGVQLLLTDTDSLDSRVADEIERLGATVAHVLGGEAAISADVEDELEALGLTTHRHAGTTRVETAIDIASKHATAATSAILARSTSSGTDPSQAFADSLAAGAWAAESGMPVLLTQTEELNDNLAAYLEDSAITAVTIVGGTSAVSAAVASDLEALGIDVDRVSGATRFETAVAIAEARGFADSSDATDGVIVVEGQDANSWAGGFAAAKFASNPKPIVLANGDDLPAPTEDFLSAGGAELFCGPLLNAAACDAAAEALGLAEAAHTNQAYTVTPGEVAVVDLAGTTVTRQYSAAVPSGTVVSIRLFDSADVTDTDGQYTFKDADGDNLADQTVNAGRITVVNGVAQTAAQQIDDITSGGTVTFTIGVNASTPANVIPVVWADPTAANGGNNRLNLTPPTTSNVLPKAPSEAFGVAGRTNFVPGEATLATHTGIVVTSVDLAGDFFTASGGTPNPATFNYDSNDVFQKSGAGITMAQFEGILSNTDVLTVAYAPDPAGVSTFNITTDNGPAVPTGVTGTVGNFDNGTTNNDVKVAYTKSTTEGATQTIRRVAVDGNGADNCTEAGTTLATGHTSGEYLDLNLANGTFLYCIKAVQGSGTVVSESADVGTGNQVVPGAADTTAPTASYRAVTTDSGLQNIGDVGDVARVIYSEAVTVASDAIIRLTEPGATGETFDLKNGVNSTITVNASAVTIGGTSYAAGRILTATITVKPVPNATVTGGDGELRWDGPPAASNQSGIRDTAGNAWVAAGNIATEITAPNMGAAGGVAAANQVTLTVDIAVNCANNATTAAQYAFNVTGGTPVGNYTPTGVTCNGTTSVVLTFAAGDGVTAASLGTVTYTQSATTSARVEGFNGRTQVSPDTQTVP